MGSVRDSHLSTRASGVRVYGRRPGRVRLGSAQTGMTAADTSARPAAPWALEADLGVHRQLLFSPVLLPWLQALRCAAGRISGLPRRGGCGWPHPPLGGRTRSPEGPCRHFHPLARRRGSSPARGLRVGAGRSSIAQTNHTKRRCATHGQRRDSHRARVLRASERAPGLTVGSKGGCRRSREPPEQVAAWIRRSGDL